MDEQSVYDPATTMQRAHGQVGAALEDAPGDPALLILDRFGDAARIIIERPRGRALLTLEMARGYEGQVLAATAASLSPNSEERATTEHLASLWASRTIRVLDDAVDRAGLTHADDFDWRQYLQAFPDPEPRIMNVRTLIADVEKRSSELDQVLARAQGLADDATDAQSSALEAAKRAEKAFARAQRAAGQVGTTAQEKAFVKYAASEARTSNQFRAATIFFLLLIIVIGVDSILFPSRFEFVDTTLVIASRATALLGLGALAAYLARQAGQHRRQAEWAQSVAVQLKSFLAFISELEGEARDTVYAAFAQRVLGEPPQPKGSSGAPDVTSVPLDALLNAVTKLNR